MSDTTGGGVTRAREPSEDEELLDELIFRQDLNEVHLLIDFVSGRSDRSLSTLAMSDPLDPARVLSSGEIVQRITQMRYPPKGDKVVNSQNAAILLTAKDRLSALAAPARGLTIAYTAMFIDAQARTFRARFDDWRRDRAERTAASAAPAVSPEGDVGNAAPPRTGPARRSRLGPHHDTRVDLAARTFPALQRHAEQFRRWRQGLGWLALISLLLTALTYWDVGLGRSVLDRLDQNWKARAAILQDYPEFATAPCDSSAAPNPPAGPAPAAGNEANRKLAACRRLLDLTTSRKSTDAELQRVFGCGETRPVLAHAWCWRWILSGSVARLDAEMALSPQATDLEKALAAEREANGDKMNSAADPAHVKIDWATAISILTVYTAYILPMLFALLGTLIGSFRAILNKIRDSELAPRDLVRMVLGIPTGLVAGIAVGLFLSPSSAPVEGAGGAAGQLTLTASGLGFLAGYASQNFFTYLENVIGTVFPNSAPATATVPQSTTTITSPPSPAAGAAGATGGSGATGASGAAGGSAAGTTAG